MQSSLNKSKVSMTEKSASKSFNKSSLDMSSGLINLEDNLPDIIHAGSSVASNSTPFKLPFGGDSAAQGSKKTPYDLQKSENFVFSPDVLPAKQTRDFMTKNQKVLHDSP